MLSVFRFCFHNVNHNKQRRQIACDEDVVQLWDYLQTRVPENFNFHVEIHLLMDIGLKNGVSDF